MSKPTCQDCYWYWQNNDTENQCFDEDEICHEFIKKGFDSSWFIMQTQVENY